MDSLKRIGLLTGATMLAAGLRAGAVFGADGQPVGPEGFKGRCPHRRRGRVERHQAGLRHGSGRWPRCPRQVRVREQL